MPDFEWEDKLKATTVGVDEAGRGPWAGPVVAGAVVIADKNFCLIMTNILSYRLHRHHIPEV